MLKNAFGQRSVLAAFRGVLGYFLLSTLAAGGLLLASKRTNFCLTEASSVLHGLSTVSARSCSPIARGALSSQPDVEVAAKAAVPQAVVHETLDLQEGASTGAQQNYATEGLQRIYLLH